MVYTLRRKKSWQQPMEKVPIETGKETLIEIEKGGRGLGLSLVGGSDTVLSSIVIHEVYPDGAAAFDGRLKTADQLLEVNGQSLRGLTHEQAISILRRTPAKVRLLVYRDVNVQMSLLDPPYMIHDLELVKKPGRGLGISIVGRKDEPGVYISEIVKGGLAEADGRLMQGDQILKINNVDVSTKMQEDVAAMFKTISGKLSIRVGRWKLGEAANRFQHISRTSNPPSTATSPNMQRPPTTASPSEPSTNGTSGLKTVSDGDEDRRVPSPAPTPSSGGYMAAPDVPQVLVQDETIARGELSPVTEEPGSSTDLKSLAEPAEIGLLPINEEGSESLLIHLKKDEGCQWGMGIGRRPRGILVTSLQPGSTAAEKLHVGDRIMAVNGVAISDQNGAVTMVKSSGNKVTLQVARPTRVPTSHY
uniref:Inactivation-no-after-D protein n=1 Tax=Bursaphelenchus xylophilus TaxID=6326 RepID=A0A1I7RYQ9_BURXY